MYYVIVYDGGICGKLINLDVIIHADGFRSVHTHTMARTDTQTEHTVEIISKIRFVQRNLIILPQSLKGVYRNHHTAGYFAGLSRKVCEEK